MPSKPICTFCRRRESERRKIAVCSACRKQRYKYPRCPNRSCEGPTYGTAILAKERFCYQCSPRKPDRNPIGKEIVVTLINPFKEKRIVYRLPEDQFNMKGDYISLIKADIEDGLILDVPWLCWLRAREC